MPDLSFRVDAKMAKLLGEQSVSNSVAAVFELVKNSYDADSNTTEVIFLGSSDKGQSNVHSIRIRDDGIGMTFEDIRDKWMVVGTDTKERATASPMYKRRVVGEKGIGRFATQRLGTVITIVSDPRPIPGRATKYQNKRITLKIDWSRYQPGKTLDEIKHKVEIGEKPSRYSYGTEITIEGLKDEWNLSAIETVRDRLSVLVVPKEITQEIKHPFEARIVAEGFELPEMIVESNLLKKAPQAIVAHLKGKMITYNIFEKGKEINKKAYEDPIQAPGLTCGNATLKLYVYPRDQAPSTKWTRYYKVMGADRLNSVLKSHAGIKIYNDNIRVMPYGEPNNDWLGLNARQLVRYGAGRINNRSVIGFVILNRNSNPGIKETTTREGLIDNNEFKDLKEFLNKVIIQFELFREERKKEETEEEKHVDPVSSVKSELKEIKDTISELPLSNKESDVLKKKVVYIDQQLDIMDSQHKTDKEEYMYSEQLYRNLATVGITTISFSHEIINPLIGMEATLTNLIRDLYEKRLSDESRRQKLNFIVNSTASMMNWANYVRAFTSLIAGSGKIRKRHKVPVSKTIDEILFAYSSVFEDNKIIVIKSIPDSVPLLHINKPDFESILINLITNSVKALKRNQEDRRIKIEANSNAHGFTLKFSDNGPGILKGEEERIFQPLYTTYTNADRGIIGTGMGLTIVKEILEEYDGEIKVDKSEWKPGASFLVTIPINSVK